MSLCPSTRRILLSISCLEKLDFSFYFRKTKFVVVNGLRNFNMYQVQLSGNIICEVSDSSLIHSNSLYLWHLPDLVIWEERFNKLIQTNLINGVDEKEFLTCESCL